MSINKVILIGRLGSDPEIKKLEGGQQVTSFSLATNERYVDKQGAKVDRVDWHRLEAWGKQAEIISKYLKKGSNVFIEGKMRTDQWEKEGQKHSLTKVIVSNVQFLDSKSSEPQQHAPAPAVGQPEEDELF